AATTLYPDDVLETVPTGATHVAGDDFTCVAPAGGSVCGNTALVSLPANCSIPLSFDVIINLPFPAAQVVNSASLPGQVDCAVAPNDCSESTPVAPRVSLAKTLATGTATPLVAGQTVTYALTLS